MTLLSVGAQLIHADMTTVIGVFFCEYANRHKTGDCYYRTAKFNMTTRIVVSVQQGCEHKIQ